MTCPICSSTFHANGSTRYCRACRGEEPIPPISRWLFKYLKSDPVAYGRRSEHSPVYHLNLRRARTIVHAAPVEEQ